MAYALESLLRIRAMREDRAGTALTGARRAKVAAENARDEKAAALASYERTKDARRDHIFGAVMGRAVSRDDLDRARGAVMRIDEEGALLEEARRQAQDELERKEREAEGARVRFVAATKQKAKIDQHKLAWEEEDRKMQEMRADAEMEEFTGRRMTSDDDDSLD